MPPSNNAFSVTTVLLLAAIGSGCAPERAPQPESETPAMEAMEATGLAAVDHVIVAIDTLERGIDLLRQSTGVAAALGGAHPGRGTQNALLSLGPRTYLELLAPNPADSAGPAQVEAFSAYRELTPTGWAAGTPNADTLRALLAARGLPGGVVAPGSRQRPDGTTLSWRTFAPWQDGSDWLLPFFIQWGATSAHPATSAPAGCTLIGLTLTSPSAESLRALLQTADLSVPVEQGPDKAITVTLECPNGRVVLGGEVEG
jgi:hypothetical protein